MNRDWRKVFGHASGVCIFRESIWRLSVSSSKAAADSANRIAFTPYVFGGGHGSFTSSGYDCSGSVSFALHGAGLLATPLDSSQFESYGQPGPGKWITIYTDPGHVFMDVAGIWFDTAAQSASNGNDRWSMTRISPKGGDGVVRHPAGW